MPPADHPASWTVLLPLKPLTAAKTRLDHPDRSAIALAMAQDTVAAVLAAGDDLVAEVIVITDDPRARAALAGLDQPAAPRQRPRLLLVADEPASGLNPALAHGARLARQRRPGCGVAALSADLPALRPDELRTALRAAPPGARAVLADAAGTGTVLLAAAPGQPLDPAFGPGSHAAHLGSGAVDLTGELAGAVPGLRRDVDTLADLAAARALGVGPATAGALRAGPTPRNAA